MVGVTGPVGDRWDYNRSLTLESNARTGFRITENKC